MSRLSAAGVARAALVFGALALFPFAFPQHWVVNLAIFTVMYAGLASSWNLLGGFSGYLSLGHAAFFGIGAYAIGILFTHIGVGAGYRPFVVLPFPQGGRARVSRGDSDTSTNAGIVPREARPLVKCDRAVRFF